MGPSPTLTPPRRRGAMPGQPPSNQGREFPPEVYTQAEMRALMGAFSRRGSAGIRNAALTALLYRCGLRVSEALKAPLADLDLAEGMLFVRHPKRDGHRGRDDRQRPLRPRRVAIDVETAAFLERWLVRRRALGISSHAPLFCQIAQPRRGERMEPNGYRGALQRAGRAAGIAKRMHPHGLRHTFAFTWLQEGRPLDQLQVLLGHKRLATTAHYAQHLNPAAALEAQRHRSWDSVPLLGPAALEAQIREIVAQLLDAG
jgi:integrase/recombinase XerD